MNDPFDKVSALPVVIPLGVVVFVLLCWRLQATRRFTLPRAAVAAALAVYGAGIVANTVFPIFLNPPPRDRSWWSGVVLTPFVDYEVGDAVTNVIVFVPLGVLIALVLQRPNWLPVLAAVVCSSLAIELTQLAVQDLAGGGHIADIDDLIFNTVGGMVGYAALLVLLRLPGGSRLVSHFRWAAPAAGGIPLDRHN